VALMTLPREEEPQISVPMVDIMLSAPGLKADDAVKLVTEPLETIVKSIDGVEHVYSQSADNKVLVTARFIVGTQTDAAILRVHDKVRANIDRIPVGCPEPLIVGRGIDDVAIVSLTLTPSPAAGDAVTANDLTRIARELQDRTLQDRRCRADLSGRRCRRDHPDCARSEAAGALRRDLAAAGRQGDERQPRLSRGPGDDQRPGRRSDGRRNALCAGRDRQPADHQP
jgi:hypothetical protein